MLFRSRSFLFLSRSESFNFIQKGKMTFSKTSFWTELRMLKSIGFLPLQITTYSARTSTFYSNFFTIISILFTVFILYSDVTFDVSHLQHKNPIIWKLVLYQTRVTWIIGIGSAYYVHEKRRLLGNIINFCQTLSLRFDILKIHVAYRKIDFRNLIEIVLVNVSCTIFAFGICIIIHPFHGVFWEQIKCGIVSKRDNCLKKGS